MIVSKLGLQGQRGQDHSAVDVTPHPLLQDILPQLQVVLVFCHGVSAIRRHPFASCLCIGSKSARVSLSERRLLDKVDVIEEELDAQEESEGHVGFLLLGIVLPSLGSYFGQFGIRVDKKKLVICKENLESRKKASI